MKKKHLYQLINEEIGNFDFLGNETQNNEKSHSDILSSKEFQTALIHDLFINNTKNIISMSATYSSKDSNMADENPSTIELELDVEYKYLDKKYGIIIFLDGEKDDDNINYDDFQIKLFSKGADEISMKWVEKNEILYKNLVKTLITPYI